MLWFFFHIFLLNIISSYPRRKIIRKLPNQTTASHLYPPFKSFCPLLHHWKRTLDAVRLGDGPHFGEVTKRKQQGS